MVRVRWVLLGVVAVLLPHRLLLGADRPLGVGVTAAGNCKFRSAAATLNFGSLDPLQGRDVSSSAALTFKCTKGSSWTVTDDGGLHGGSAGVYRLRHLALDAYLPYRLTYGNATGTSQGANIVETLTIEGLIRGADFLDARQGNYTDTVTLSINP